MRDSDKKLDGFVAGYHKYKTKYSLMVRFAEKRLYPEIEGLKVQRRILIENKERYDIEKWNLAYTLLCERLKHLESLYEELSTIIKA